MRLRVIFRLLIVILACSGSWLNARVLRVEILSRQEVLNGKQFAKAGAYERLTGRIYFSVRVADQANRRIFDLANAVNLSHGEVEFSADFFAMRPKDISKSNGSLLLEIPNRGSTRILSLVDGGDWELKHDAGDAWFLRNGYTVAALGWQWDAPGSDALRLYAPIAKDHGRPITGLLRGDLTPSKLMNDIPLGHLITGRMGGTEYPVSDPNDPRNVLTVRSSPLAPRQMIPRSEWQFAHSVDGTLKSDNRYIHLNDGFQPGKLYEYVYVVSNPVIAGLGFAAVRDFASYVKHRNGAFLKAKRVYGQGISQDGRFLRDFLYQGFNADEQGQPALDAVLAHVAGAGRGSFNYRFAQPSRDSEPTSSIFFPTDLFPFTSAPETDPLTGQTAGLLDVAKADKVLPKIFFSNTSYEYWGRVAALIHTTADGKRDVPIPTNVRIYHFTGLQHFSGPFPPQKGSGDLAGQHPESPLPVKFFWRAMIQNMDAWVRNNTPPPDSSYPTIADGTLVSLANYAFPPIPYVQKPHDANMAYRLNFGPNWQQGILANQPPIVAKPFPVLVPQVDSDGNEKDGVRLPEITVPLATYTGWNLRDPSIGAPTQRVAFEGSYLPFPKTEADRQRTRDPRLSIAARYLTRADYIAPYTAAVDRLVRQGWILPEDRAALIQRGEQEWSVATD
jgi:hypothetical protein